MSMFYDLLIAQAKKKKEPIWCEYLESDSNQYIDTDVIDNKEKTFNITFSPTMLDNVSDVRYFGAINGLWVALKQNLTLGIGGADIVTAQPDTKYTFKLYRDEQGRRSCDYNGAKYTGTPNNDGGYRYNLFNVSSNRPAFFSKVYSFQAYEGNKLVRNFRPCLHPDTLRPAMYDTVNKKYYYNEGTGEFKYKLSFTKLDYIESTGEQYIRPNCVFTTDTARVKTKINIKEILASKAVFGWQGESTYFGTLLLRDTGYADLYPLGFLSAPYKVGDNEICFYRDPNKASLNINGNEKVLSSTYTFEKNLEFLTIFGNSSRSNFTSQGFHGSIYYFELYDNEILVRDYIPVRMNDGQIGMWDYVEGKFYPNLGTNSKFKGYLNGYQVGESIDNTSSSYIDTRVNPSYNFDIELGFVKHSGQKSSLFGNEYQTSSPGPLGLCCYASDGINFHYFAGSFFGGGTSFNIQEEIQTRVKFGITSSNSGYYIKNNERHDVVNDGISDLYQENSVFLLANNDKVQGAIQHCKAKINYCIINKDNKLVRNFIPVQKDGFIGMIDTLTGKEYHNLGSGSFIIPGITNVFPLFQGTGTYTTSEKLKYQISGDNVHIYGDYDAKYQTWLIARLSYEPDLAISLADVVDVSNGKPFLFAGRKYKIISTLKGNYPENYIIVYADKSRVVYTYADIEHFIPEKDVIDIWYRQHTNDVGSGSVDIKGMFSIVEE